MSTSAERSEIKNPKTGMTLAEMKEFIRNHFEEFVNRKNLRIGDVNFALGLTLRSARRSLPPRLPAVSAKRIQAGPEVAHRRVKP